MTDLPAASAETPDDTPAAQPEPAMDIHKPKPVHSWREFFSEIMVIVIGICIALIGEQIVEKIHERIVADEAREQVEKEMATDLAVLTNRTRSEPCINKRIDELDAKLAAAGTPAYVAPNWVGKPSSWDNQTARWQAASQSGRMALLTPYEQGEISFIYSEIAALQQAQADEPEQWAHLAALQGVAHPSPGLIDAARLALVRARLDDEAIHFRIAESTNALRAMGVAPVPSPVVTPMANFSICWPIDLPTAEGYRRLAAQLPTDRK
ncbi:MAG: hypothetical protein ACRCSO_06905 [Sphingomonas sp.]